LQDLVSVSAAEERFVVRSQCAARIGVFMSVGIAILWMWSGMHVNSTVSGDFQETLTFWSLRLAFK
jgi:hypothetical protein